jgi:hypothetical protein
VNFKKSVSIFITNELAALKEFYTIKLDFVVTFDSPGYLGLRCTENPSIELGFMAPEPGQSTYQGGIYFGLEVIDVDATHESLKRKKVKIDQPPTSNPWGDRSCIIHDPIGLVLYFSTPIPPSAEYAKYFK